MVNQEKALGRLWTDTCTAVVREGRADPKTHLTAFLERVLFADQPCKLSFGTLPTAEGSPASAGQTVKVFLDADLTVPAGSRLTVTHRGRVYEFAQSGRAGVFSHHQEIPLEQFEGWA